MRGDDGMMTFLTAIIAVVGIGTMVQQTNLLGRGDPEASSLASTTQSSSQVLRVLKNDRVVAAVKGRTRIDVLANDEGVLTADASLLEIVSLPKCGRALVADGAVHYLPDPTCDGIQRFHYGLTDAPGFAEVVLTVHQDVADVVAMAVASKITEPTGTTSPREVAEMTLAQRIEAALAEKAGYAAAVAAALESNAEAVPTIEDAPALEIEDAPALEIATAPVLEIGTAPALEIAAAPAPYVDFAVSSASESIIVAALEPAILSMPAPETAPLRISPVEIAEVIPVVTGVPTDAASTSLMPTGSVSDDTWAGDSLSQTASLDPAPRDLPQSATAIV